MTSRAVALKEIVMCVSIGSVGLSLFVRFFLLANSHEEQKKITKLFYSFSRDLSLFSFSIETSRGPVLVTLSHLGLLAALKFPKALKWLQVKMGITTHV